MQKKKYSVEFSTDVLKLLYTFLSFIQTKLLSIDLYVHTLREVREHLRKRSDIWSTYKQGHRNIRSDLALDPRNRPRIRFWELDFGIPQVTTIRSLWQEIRGTSLTRLVGRSGWMPLPAVLKMEWGVRSDYIL